MEQTYFTKYISILYRQGNRFYDRELAKYNIRVNCVSPGYVATEVVTDWSDELQGWIDRTPQKRMGTPEDIAGAYLYLASDASRYATGTELLIDGGYTAI